MAFRFQRRLKLFPGFRLNLSKSGVSASAGIPGFTVNSRGTTTVGIPGTGLSYRHHHKTESQDARQPEEPQNVGYSSDEVNDMVRELRDQIIDKVYLGLWTYDGDGNDVVAKTLAEETCSAVIQAQAKLLPDLETIEEYVRDGNSVEECSDRAQEILKAIVDVLHYGDEMGWCSTEPSS